MLHPNSSKIQDPLLRYSSLRILTPQHKENKWLQDMAQHQLELEHLETLI